MTRAVTLAEIAEGDILNIDGTNNRIGIGTTNPQALLQVGTGVSVYGNSGIVSATKYYGSGANLTGITAGATLSAGSGAQRVVVTSLTSGTMTSAATDAELTYNSTSNTLSATTFSGALTGNATGLTGTPDITVRNIIGVGATLSGVLTYEDVTNIDSVGLVTARAGVVIVGGGLTVTGISTFGGNLLPEANGTRDLGATGTRWANLYTSDIDLSNEAKGGNEVDGTWGSYTIQEGENDLFLINRRTGKKFKFVLEEVN